MQNRPTVLVRTNDTLISLAETYYLDPNIALLIADLNAGHIRDTQMDGKRIIELQSGQKLIMPIAVDIERFYLRLAKKPRVENLITIVHQPKPCKKTPGEIGEISNQPSWRS